MAPRIDPAPYLRFPRLDVSGALSLAQILLRRMPERASPQVRRAAATVEAAVVELKSKWKQKRAPLVVKVDARPLIRDLGAAWRAVRNRLVAWDAAPERSVERTRARAIYEVLFRNGLDFTQVTFINQHTESAQRIELIDERASRRISRRSSASTSLRCFEPRIGRSVMRSGSRRRRRPWCWCS